MPTPPTYKCGSPGCGRKFEKPEYLRQHTQDSHSPSKPLPKQPTFKCGVVGCQAKPFPHQHTKDSPKPPPKYAFKCGVKGCNAASFPQLSLLHQHTKDSHSSPKPPPKYAFKCGVKGCNAASFPQLSLLHQHTAVAHPKSSSQVPKRLPLPRPQPSIENVHHVDFDVPGDRATQLPPALDTEQDDERLMVDAD
ncbi:hypothetical protein C8J57DRAFT_472642 [Mycena rebaudengoi]|nr:hypothetical protein C8J57DRAFT_472642 [Mycena rebaudengoi]